MAFSREMVSPVALGSEFSLLSREMVSPVALGGEISFAPKVSSFASNAAGEGFSGCKGESSFIEICPHQTPTLAVWRKCTFLFYSIIVNPTDQMKPSLDLESTALAVAEATGFSQVTAKAGDSSSETQLRVEVN